MGTAAKESEDFSKKRLKVEHLENNEELARGDECDVKDAGSQKDRYKEKQKDYGNATLTNDKTKETERHPKPKESEDDKTEHTLSNGTGTHDEAIETKRNGEPLFGDENQNKSKTDEIMGIKTTSVSEINCDHKNKLHKNEKCTLYLQNRAALPFPGACRSFYARQYAKVTKKHQKTKSSRRKSSIT